MRLPPITAARRAVLATWSPFLEYLVLTVHGTLGTVKDGDTAVGDRRRSRWEAHRRTRREELVDAALTAIREHGPSVGMDEVAAKAATSKAGLYRHFADKTQLYLAVCTRVADTLLGQLRPVAEPGTGPREVLTRGIDAYLQLIERDPHVYRFVVHHPALDRPVDGDQVAGLVGLVADRIAGFIEAPARAAGLSPTLTVPWAHGVVGLVRAAADPWMEGRVFMTRAELGDTLTDLLWPGLSRLYPAQSENS
jgi:AcrR family transcriptional regulator